MPLDTQISSYVVPPQIWENGHKSAHDLPPLRFPARDAIAIERRAAKKVNLRNEQRRYTLCCERMQGIVHELSQIEGILPPPMIWSAHDQSNPGELSARSYLAIVAVVGRWMSRFLRDVAEENPKLIYPRLPTMFFPPEDAEHHLKCFELIAGHPNLSALFARAARDATLEDSSFMVSETECRGAFFARYELVKEVAAKGYGLVDVLELA